MAPSAWPTASADYAVDAAAEVCRDTIAVSDSWEGVSSRNRPAEREQRENEGQMSAGQPSHPATEEPTATVLVYASDRTVRTAIRQALGRKVATDLPRIAVVETATQPAAVKAVEAGGIDVIVLDGESRPGGMGVCRQLKDEIFNCPPMALVTGRADDAWLATWSRADAVMPRPLDPFRLPDLVAALLRQRLQQPAAS